MNRIAHYDSVFHPRERTTRIGMRMVRGDPDFMDEIPKRGEWVKPTDGTPADLISYRCVSCHTLERMRRYKHDDWARVVGRMRAYGTKMTGEEEKIIVDHLQAGLPY